MSTGAVIGIIIVVIVIAALVVAAVVALGALRRARLQRQFGPEYDRLVKARGRKKAYSGDWAAIQQRFVDTPVEAVGAAHTLIWNVMRDRGYPTDDRTASMDALSVHHSRSMEGYRRTQDLRADSASTEQLREAMIRYRSLFEDVTGMREGRGEPARDRVASTRDPAAEDSAVERAAESAGRTANPPR